MARDIVSRINGGGGEGLCGQGILARWDGGREKFFLPCRGDCVFLHF